jgi:hypothetical protein
VFRVVPTGGSHSDNPFAHLLGSDLADEEELPPVEDDLAPYRRYPWIPQSTWKSVYHEDPLSSWAEEGRKGVPGLPSWPAIILLSKVKKSSWPLHFIADSNGTASSTSVERACSAAGNFHGANRPSLLPATIQATSLLKAWWRSDALGFDSLLSITSDTDEDTGALGRDLLGDLVEAPGYWADSEDNTL